MGPALSVPREVLASKLERYSAANPERVHLGVPCREWQRSLNSKGYGLVCVGGGRSALAHRVSYEVSVGQIPDGHSIDHRCRNRPCIEPRHLEPVTGRENTRRGESFSAKNGRKVRCIHGHALAGSNVQVRANGQRRCMTCHRAQKARGFVAHSSIPGARASGDPSTGPAGEQGARASVSQDDDAEDSGETVDQHADAAYDYAREEGSVDE
jgi:hypothetical protein